MATTVEMIEIEEPRLVQFNTGDVVDGTLIGIEKAKIKDKETGVEKVAVKYIIVQPDGVTVFFWGTHQLNQKLRLDHVGHLISIRCEGTDTMVVRNGNPMKVFKVLVSKEKAKDSDLYISDADIPF